MLRQLIFAFRQNRELKVRHTILTDIFVPIEDVVSPQKTELTIPKTNKVELNDIVIIRNNDNNIIDFIGYIDTISNKEVTKISCYPLINAFDNDFVLDQMYKKSTNQDGTTTDIEVDCGQWLSTQLQRAFIDTDDDLQALPLIIRNRIERPVLYKKVIDTSNLFEVYTDLVVNTGIYILFSDLSYSENKINGIYCDIYCNFDKKPYNLRWDNPQIQNVDIVDNTFTNYNKIIATQELEEGATGTPKRYYFYLLNDNSITTDPTDARRIKQVRSKEITFTLEANKTDEENINALILAVLNELQAPEYNLKITIEMFANDNIKMYRRINFLGDNGVVYDSSVTRIEKLNDLQIKITLGALRNSLTDFKKKVEAI